MPRTRVLLIGWGNAAPSQLAAYERMHTALGTAASSVIPDTRTALVDPGAFARALGPAADRLAAERGAGPLLVHLFSDNGFIGWAALLAHLEGSARGREALAEICGVVFDSSPGLWAVRGRIDFARRFALGMTPVVARGLRLGARERVPIVTPLLGLGFLAYQLAFPRAVRAMVGARETVERVRPRCPHLFLYGGRDALVSPRDVRAWIARERARGLDVTDVCFDDARHVALYPADPRRYVATVRAFVDRCVGAEAST